MLTRRGAVLLAGLSLTHQALAAAALPTITLGTLEFGTAAWEVETIRRFGLDEAAGLHIGTATLASNEAAKIAFLGGSVDTIVSDLLWAARLRGEGRNIIFLPFSSTEGAVMLPAQSAIGSIGDLRGKRLGISGGALDKSWLLLQAMALQTDGFDLAKSVRPAFGAPPLLDQKLEAGELDAALLFWTFCARLEAKGFKRLLGADDMVKALGIEAPISFLGYVFDRDRLGDRAAQLPAFAAASRGAKAKLARDPDAWTTVRPLMQAGSDATFAILRRAFIAGIPDRPVVAERADAERLYALLARLGGDRLVGGVTTLPAGLYWTGGS